MSFLLACNVGLIALQKRLQFLRATDHLAKNVPPKDFFAPFTFIASIVRTPPVRQEASIINGRYGIIGDGASVDRGEDTNMAALIEEVSC